MADRPNLFVTQGGPLTLMRKADTKKNGHFSSICVNARSSKTEVCQRVCQQDLKDLKCARVGAAGQASEARPSSSMPVIKRRPRPYRRVAVKKNEHANRVSMARQKLSSAAGLIAEKCSMRAAFL
jgi:hypothetical protein